MRYVPIDDFDGFAFHTRSVKKLLLRPEMRPASASPAIQSISKWACQPASQLAGWFGRPVSGSLRENRCGPRERGGCPRCCRIFTAHMWLQPVGMCRRAWWAVSRCCGRLLNVVTEGAQHDLLPRHSANTPATVSVPTSAVAPQLPVGVPMGESIGHSARFARIANVKPSPITNPWT